MKTRGLGLGKIETVLGGEILVQAHSTRGKLSTQVDRSKTSVSMLQMQPLIEINQKYLKNYLTSV